MIGKTLWNEFFTNRDWPVSSAVAVILLLLLVVPIMIFQRAASRQEREARTMKARFSWFNITSIVLGFAFLYLPIVLLVVYSFNESKLVTVWGGFSTKWYVSLLPKPGPDGRRLGDDPRRRSSRPRSRPCSARWRARAVALHPLPRPHAVFRHDLRAAGHAGGHHRPVAAAAVRRHRLRPRLLDGHARPHHLHHVLRRRRRAVAAC